MGKLMLTIISFMLVSCAYITIEERFVPSKVAYKEASEKPVSGGSVNHTIEFDSISIYSSFNLYQTNKRGLYFLGAEVSEERNRKFNDYNGEIVLRIGVKPNISGQKISFIPSKLKLILESEKGDIASYRPYKAFKTKKEIFCSFDFNEKGWGTSSTTISNEENLITAGVKENMFHCYNIMYKTKGERISEICILIESYTETKEVCLTILESFNELVNKSF